jgi:hypothetical protein
VANDDWIELGHDGIDGTHRKPRRALKHWTDRGWFEVAPADPPPAAAQDARRRTASTGQES